MITEQSRTLQCIILTECNDPARPPVRGCNNKFIHWKLRRTVENIYFRIFTFLLIIIDICLVIAGRVYILPFTWRGNIWGF